MSQRRILLKKVKLAEKTQRYNDMINYLRELKLADTDYNLEEHNLSAVAYKNLIDPLRCSLKIIENDLSKAEQEHSPFLEYDKLFADQVKKELQCQIQLAIHELDKFSPVGNPVAEAEITFLSTNKRKADYYRYLAELQEGNEREYLAEFSLIAYKQAQSLASRTLPRNNAIRLAVALNYATFHCALSRKLEMACQIAREAYDDALMETEELNEEQKADSDLLVQMLKSNVEAWTKELRRGLKAKSAQEIQNT